MSSINRLPIAPHIEEAAAAWVARHDTGPLDAAEAAEFEAWLQASPAHRAAFELYGDLWSDFDNLSSRSQPVEAAPPEPANDAADFRISRRAVAAGAALLFVSAVTYAGFILNRAPAPEAFETAVGEQRTVTLADRSRVTLNTDTRFVVEFSERERRIVMERGEAFFEVAHDSARPFTVSSAAGSVRAIGTRFVVRVRGERELDVMVTEGRVLVSRSPAQSGERADMARSAPLSAGQQLRTDQPVVATVTPQEITRELAWRQGDVVFSGEPLSAAAAEMQRYTPTRISVDPAVAHYSVGGYFRTNDLEAFLQTVQSVFPVRVVRSPDEVRLVARQS